MRAENVEAAGLSYKIIPPKMRVLYEHRSGVKPKAVE